MIAIIKKFLKSFRLGQVIYPTLNKVYRWYSVPARRRNMKRNGYRVLDEVYEISIKHNLKCFAVFGSLLGYIREGGFIPHDCDLDFGVLPGTPPCLHRAAWYHTLLPRCAAGSPPRAPRQSGPAPSTASGGAPSPGRSLRDH